MDQGLPWHFCPTEYGFVGTVLAIGAHQVFVLETARASVPNRLIVFNYFFIATLYGLILIAIMIYDIGINL